MPFQEKNTLNVYMYTYGSTKSYTVPALVAMLSIKIPTCSFQNNFKQLFLVIQFLNNFMVEIRAPLYTHRVETILTQFGHSLSLWLNLFQPYVPAVFFKVSLTHSSLSVSTTMGGGRVV